MRISRIFILTICNFGEGKLNIFFSSVKKLVDEYLLRKGVKSGHNQMSPTDQGSSSLIRLPHPQVIAAKLFNCPKLPPNDVE